MAMEIEQYGQFEVFLICLDPTVGSEMKKKRPCVVVSPNEMNQHLHTVIIAPLTSVIRKYPTRVQISFQEKTGEVALDQIRAVDTSRLEKKMGILSGQESQKICHVLSEIFAYHS